jgi:hypothetical protein
MMTNLRLSQAQLKATAGLRQAHAKRAKRNGKLWDNISVPWGKFRPKKGRQAAPEPKLERTAAAPTPERQRRDDWETQTHPGGQVSYRARPAHETYKEHLDQDLLWTARKIIDDAEKCTAANIICARAYTGMPYAVPRSSLSEDQADAQARFRWIMGGMDERFRSAVSFLIIGMRSERMGAPRDFAALASRYRDPATKNAFTAGFLKAALIRVSEAYRAYGAGLRARAEQRELTNVSRET